MRERVDVGELVTLVARSEPSVARCDVWPAFREFMAGREAELAAMPDPGPGATPAKKGARGAMSRGNVQLGVHATPGRRLSIGSAPPTPGCPPTPYALGAGQFFCDDFDDPFGSLFGMGDDLVECGIYCFFLIFFS
jgi:hypothetical protein